jgi:L-fuconolactonase
MTQRIDAHHHVWDLGVRDQSWITGAAMEPLRRNFSLSQLRPLAAASGVGATVLVQTLSVAAETPELLALADGDELVAGVVGWVDLTAADAADRIAAAQSGPGGDRLVGIRHPVQDEADPDWLNRPAVLRGLRAVMAAGLAYDLLTVPHQLPAAINAVRLVPELRFILDHGSKPPIRSGEMEPWAGEIRRLAANPNVACKMSGLVTEADWRNWTVSGLRRYTDVLLDAFGPQRLMFGSDWPVCLLAAPYPRVVAATEELTADLGEAERADIYAGTARSWYGLSLDSEARDRPSPRVRQPVRGDAAQLTPKTASSQRE